MRRIFIALIIVVVALAGLGNRGMQQPAQPTFIPQVPTASRTDDSRVFLEKADILYKQQFDSFMIVSGNVVFTKGPMTMICDSAHYYPQTESFDAFGNVTMEQGDTLFIYADELNYRGPEQVCYLYARPGEKVRLINRDVTLETYEFIYDLGINLGYYTVGGVLYDKRNRLVSREGEYDPTLKEANFYMDVHLNSENSDDTLDIYTDTLYYNTTTHISELTSPSIIVNRRGIIRTRNGLYDTALDTAALYDRSTVTTPSGRSMIADTIFYDRPGGVGECFGAMILTDSARQASLSADYGFFNSNTDSAYATGRLLIKEYSKGDTLYLHGRQLNAYRVYDTIPITGMAADTLNGTSEMPDSFSVDTSNVADIWPHVRFYRSDMQGVCDSLRATSVDSAVRMYVEPVVWSGEQQIFGNLIELFMNDSTIREARLPDFGFVSQRIYGDYYDQMAGKEMVAMFDAGELRQLDISGNVEFILFPDEADSTFNKMVQAQSSFLKAIFRDNSTEYVKMWPETSGKATPLFQLRRSMIYLPKFRLFHGMRPLSPADVMTADDEGQPISSTIPVEDDGPKTDSNDEAVKPTEIRSTAQD